MTKEELIRAIVLREDYRFTHDELMRMTKKQLQKVYENDSNRKIRKEIERRMNDNLKAEEKYNNGLFGSKAKEDFDLLSFLDTIEEEHFRDSTKMIKELEMPYQSVDSGLVLDIPELVEKINEIIRYLNEKEEE